MNGLCYWTDNTTDVQAPMETIIPLVNIRKYKPREKNAYSGREGKDPLDL
jgi:hypothetical protein